MTTLECLGVTPAHLTGRARDLVYMLRNHSCAWKVRAGWSTKTGHQVFQSSTADILIGRQLALVARTKGPPRLELTAAGEELAAIIAQQRKAAAARIYHQDRQRRRSA